MAQDIIPLDPIKGKCPWCGKPVLIEHSLAVYDLGESLEQYGGIKKDEGKIPRLLKGLTRGNTLKGRKRT